MDNVSLRHKNLALFKEIQVLSKKVDAPLGPLEIEAKAFEVGLQFTKDVGIHDLILEGDSLVIMLQLAFLLPLLQLLLLFMGLGLYFKNSKMLASHMYIGKEIVQLISQQNMLLAFVDFLVWMEESHCFLMKALHHDVISSII